MDATYIGAEDMCHHRASGWHQKYNTTFRTTHRCSFFSTYHSDYDSTKPHSHTFTYQVQYNINQHTLWYKTSTKLEVKPSCKKFMISNPPWNEINSQAKWKLAQNELYCGVVASWSLFCLLMFEWCLDNVLCNVPFCYVMKIIFCLRKNCLLYIIFYVWPLYH